MEEYKRGNMIFRGSVTGPIHIMLTHKSVLVPCYSCISDSIEAFH